MMMMMRSTKKRPETYHVDQEADVAVTEGAYTCTFFEGRKTGHGIGPSKETMPAKNELSTY